MFGKFLSVNGYNKKANRLCKHFNGYEGDNFASDVKRPWGKKIDYVVFFFWNKHKNKLCEKIYRISCQSRICYRLALPNYAMD